MNVVLFSVVVVVVVEGMIGIIKQLKLLFQLLVVSLYDRDELYFRVEKL